MNKFEDLTKILRCINALEVLFELEDGKLLKIVSRSFVESLDHLQTLSLDERRELLKEIYARAEGRHE